MIPGFRQSGSREKSLSITKEGSRLLRGVLVEAAWMAVRYSPKWKGIFERLVQRTRQRKKAIVAVARRLLCVMVSLLRQGCAYNPVV